jgi:hypothetical protein
MNYSVVTAGTVSTTTIAFFSVLVNPSTDTVLRYTSGTTQTITTDSATRYSWITGVGAQASTEGDVQVKMNVPCVFRNMYVGINANDRDSTTTFRTRINGSNGNQVVSIAAFGTGITEDTTNSDSIADEDLVNYSIVTGTGAGELITYRIGTEMVTKDGRAQWIADTSRNFLANATRFLAIAGQFQSSATETDVRAEMNEDVRVSLLHIRVTANGVTADSTMRVRKNGANGNGVVTIPNATTGRFEDTTNVDHFTAADEISISLVTGATGTSLDASYVSLVLNTLALPDPILTYGVIPYSR